MQMLMFAHILKGSRQYALRTASLAPHGMVACAHYLATQAGVQILTQGGNAIDAAIAANAVMTVVYPTTCSAGGDIFLLIWEAKTQQLHALNGSGRAPQGMTPEYFAARGMTENSRARPTLDQCSRRG